MIKRKGNRNGKRMKRQRNENCNKKTGRKEEETKARGS